MDYTKLATVIDGAVQEKVGKISAHVRLGTVSDASEKTASVVMDGSRAATTMARCCACSAGDRVVVLRQGTQSYAIARVGG